MRYILDSSSINVLLKKRLTKSSNSASFCLLYLYEAGYFYLYSVFDLHSLAAVSLFS